ncbi:MAG: hypothetical protein NTV19_20950 [Burkholderiales bacterium]|nr:hypothetical protein [Burkholderiales bacterium]
MSAAAAMRFTDEVHAQHREPAVERLVVQGAQLVDMDGAMHQRVQSAELRADGGRRRLEIGIGRLREIEREQRRLRSARGDDLVVDRVELLLAAPVQNHMRAVPCTGECNGAAEALAGAGDHHDPVAQAAGGGRIGVGQSECVHVFRVLGFCPRSGGA